MSCVAGISDTCADPSVGLKDTCSVLNLRGLPGLLGRLTAALSYINICHDMALADTRASLLAGQQQALCQVFGVLVTPGMAVVTL